MMNDSEIITIIKKQAAPLKPIPTGLVKRGSLTTAVRAVLFDLYGTLFISGSGDITVLEEAVKTDRLISLLMGYGVDMDPVVVTRRYLEAIQEEHERLRGEGVDYPEVVVERIWRSVLGFESEQHARLFAAEYESIFNPVWPMPHLAELLEELRKRGMVMGIISNAQFFTPLLFDAFLGSGPRENGFGRDLALYSYVYGFAKPSFFLYEMAKKQLELRGIAVSEALFVGNDMLNDIYAAQSCGFKTALFAGDGRSLRLRSDDARCSGVTPDVTVIDLMQLSEIVKI
jgi:putative hydrolase of the HAD superfamily